MLRARDIYLRESPLDSPPENIPNRLRPIQRTIKSPPPDPQLARNPIQLVLRNGFIALIIIGLWTRDGGIEEHVSQGGHVLQDHGYAQGTDDFHYLVQVVVAGEGYHVGLVAAWIGHEPESEFSDYAVVGLGEDSVVVGAETWVSD